jgi:hypothetical protein
MDTPGLMLLDYPPLRESTQLNAILPRMRSLAWARMDQSWQGACMVWRVFGVTRELMQ